MTMMVAEVLPDGVAASVGRLCEALVLAGVHATVDRVRPAACVAVRARIQSLNPDYEMKLYDDADIDRFMKDNFDEHVYKCFASLRVGAARADLWRYCVLYKHGGVYLDIDAGINSSLDSLIRPVDKYILSREGNPNIFLQWMLISAPGHPILGKAIDLCVRNISRRNTNNIIMLTGPNGFALGRPRSP